MLSMKEEIDMVYTAQYPSPLGMITLASDGQNLTGLWLEGQKDFARTLKGKMPLQEEPPVLQAAKRWLDRYFAGERPKIDDLPLAPEGSRFQQEVWKLLCEIPYGSVTTYGELARKIAAIQKRPSMSPQAVGSAVGRNPISIIIPCHRVVGTSGSLTGYAGGIGKKIQLLEREGADTSRFTIPTKGTAL